MKTKPNKHPKPRKYLASAALTLGTLALPACTEALPEANPGKAAVTQPAPEAFDNTDTVASPEVIDQFNQMFDSTNETLQDVYNALSDPKGSDSFEVSTDESNEFSKVYSTVLPNGARVETNQMGNIMRVVYTSSSPQGDTVYEFSAAVTLDGRQELNYSREDFDPNGKPLPTYVVMEASLDPSGVFRGNLREGLINGEQVDSPFPQNFDHGVLVYGQTGEAGPVLQYLNINFSGQD